MKQDIQSREDLDQIISTFYQRLIEDEELFPFFKEIVENNELEHHLSIIVDFWEDLLFQTYKYTNNPMQKHLDFQQKRKFEKHHFHLWLQYLHQTIDDGWKGDKALMMKTRASSIATVMQVKMNLFES